MATDAAEMKGRALELGFDTVGVAPAVPSPHFDAYRQWLAKGYHGTMQYLARHAALKASPDMLMPGARSVVAVTLGYNRPNDFVPGRPRIARYALGRDYHKVLRGKLRRLAGWIEERHEGSRNRVCVDTAPILERDYANLAGLGWFGKNTMLIDSKRGSWFFLGLLLTTVEFTPDSPAAGSCGTCRKCVEACPTGAIVYEDRRWQIDARRCVSYLTIEHRGEIDPEFEAGIGDWTFGCDVCQEVCPFNSARESQPQRAGETREPDFQSHRQLPTLTDLADITRERWDEVTRGTALRRTGYEGLKRNARINLRQAAKRQIEPAPAASKAR